MWSPNSLSPLLSSISSPTRLWASTSGSLLICRGRHIFIRCVHPIPSSVKKPRPYVVTTLPCARIGIVKSLGFTNQSLFLKSVMDLSLPNKPGQSAKNLCCSRLAIGSEESLREKSLPFSNSAIRLISWMMVVLSSTIIRINGNFSAMKRILLANSLPTPCQRLMMWT